MGRILLIVRGGRFSLGGKNLPPPATIFLKLVCILPLKEMKQSRGVRNPTFA